MRAKDPSAPAGKAVYGVVAAVFLSLVVYLSLFVVWLLPQSRGGADRRRICRSALPDYKNPLASVDWNALTAKVSRGGSDLLCVSSSSSSSPCAQTSLPK